MQHFEWFFRLLTLVFAIGWIGCLLTIPLAAYGFFSVLFDKNVDQEAHQEFESPAPAKS